MNIGTAVVDYTPETGLAMMGHYRQNAVAFGVHDRLFSKAIIFENANTKFAMLAVDICMMNRENVKLMRDYICRRTNLASERILIAATHTHHGPSVFEIGLMPKTNDAAIERMLTKAAQAVIEANNRFLPAKISVGNSQVDGIAFNRRLYGKDSKLYMNWEPVAPDFIAGPAGPVDHEFLAMSIDSGGPRAAVLNFAVHPAVLKHDDFSYSADYPGYISEEFAKKNQP